MQFPRLAIDSLELQPTVFMQIAKTPQRFAIHHKDRNFLARISSRGHI
jgi:hypothetical protein